MLSPTTSPDGSPFMQSLSRLNEREHRGWWRRAGSNGSHELRIYSFLVDFECLQCLGSGLRVFSPRACLRAPER